MPPHILLDSTSILDTAFKNGSQRGKFFQNVGGCLQKRLGFEIVVCIWPPEQRTLTACLICNMYTDSDKKFSGSLLVVFLFQMSNFQHYCFTNFKSPNLILYSLLHTLQKNGPRKKASKVQSERIQEEYPALPGMIICPGDYYNNKICMCGHWLLSDRISNSGQTNLEETTKRFQLTRE